MYIDFQMIVNATERKFRCPPSCWCGSMVEQLTCNQQVEGSIPFTSSNGKVAERPNATDCKSVVLRLRWFESISSHQKKYRYIAHK